MSGLSKKAMSIGSSADGGFEVPTELDSALQRVAVNESAILRVCKVVDRATDAYVQNVASTLPANAWVAEGASRTVTASPTLSQVTFTRGGVYAVCQASTWYVQDGTHDVEKWLTEEIGRSLGASIGAAIAVGDGTNKPKGIAANVPVATADASRAFGTLQYVPSGAASTISLDACLTALMTLHPSYQTNASFVMSNTTALALRSQKASTAGTFMWNPDSAAGQPPTLFGRPVLIDVNLPDVAANSLSVYVGDWQRGYTVINRVPPCSSATRTRRRARSSSTWSAASAAASRTATPSVRSRPLRPSHVQAPGSAIRVQGRCRWHGLGPRLHLRQSRLLRRCGRGRCLQGHARRLEDAGEPSPNALPPRHEQAGRPLDAHGRGLPRALRRGAARPEDPGWL